MGFSFTPSETETVRKANALFGWRLMHRITARRCWKVCIRTHLYHLALVTSALITGCTQPSAVRTPRSSVICLLFSAERDYRVFSKLRNPYCLFNDDFGLSGHKTVWRNSKAPDATFRIEKFRGFPQNASVNTRMSPRHRRSLLTTSLPTRHSSLHYDLIRLSVTTHLERSEVWWHFSWRYATQRKVRIHIMQYFLYDSKYLHWSSRSFIAAKYSHYWYRTAQK